MSVGATLLQRCLKCDWERLTRTASRSIAERELSFLYCCPVCQSTKVSHYLRPGQYKLGDLKAELREEFREER